MNDVEELTQLAHDCLRTSYGESQAHVELISQHSFNTVFRVETPGGRSVLRVGAKERIHPPGTEDVEAAWLESLADAGFATARNLPLMDGSRWTLARSDVTANDRVVTRFSWVDGVLLRSKVDAQSATAAGELLARLHDHAAEHMTAPPPEDGLCARAAVYFGDRNLVAVHRSSHGSLFRDAIARVQEHIDMVWDHGATPHLIHGDFGPHNVLAHQGSLRPIDFQDLRYGFPVQDVGITVSDMSRSAPALVASFLSGYRSVRDLAELSPDRLATLAAARSLNIMNLALLSPESGIGAVFDTHADRIVAWMSKR